MNGVGFGRIDGVSNEEEGEEDGRKDEGVLDHGLFRTSDEATSTAPFREALSAIGLHQRYVSSRGVGGGG